MLDRYLSKELNSVVFSPSAILIPPVRPLKAINQYPSSTGHQDSRNIRTTMPLWFTAPSISQWHHRFVEAQTKKPFLHKLFTKNGHPHFTLINNDHYFCRNPDSLHGWNHYYPASTILRMNWWPIVSNGNYQGIMIIFVQRTSLEKTRPMWHSQRKLTIGWPVSGRNIITTRFSKNPSTKTKTSAQGSSTTSSSSDAAQDEFERKVKAANSWRRCFPAWGDQLRRRSFRIVKNSMVWLKPQPRSNAWRRR